MVVTSIGNNILESTLSSEAYARKVLPYLKPEYFTDPSEQLVFEMIRDHVEIYSKVPTREILALTINQRNGVGEELHKNILSKIEELNPEAEVQLEWAIEQAESFCKDRALFNALSQSILIAQGEEKNLSKGAIPDLLTEALSVSFDDDLGQSYFDDAEARYRRYREGAIKIAFSHETFNKATNGGFESKTLNNFLAPSNVGKTIMLCDIAANALLDGHDVYYATMEMSEDKITERIDANILDIQADKIKELGESLFLSKVHTIQGKTRGNLYVKQFPTGTTTAAQIKAHLKELKIKKRFKPKIICVDYIGIMSSSRYKSSSFNSYHAFGFVAQELRAMAIELDAAVWSALQTNRDAYNASDISEADTAESMSIYHVSDLVWGLIRTEELDRMGCVMFKQLKSRYSNKSKMYRFLMGIDIDKFKLFETDQNVSGDSEPEVHQLPDKMKQLEQKIEESEKDASKYGAFDFS